MYAGSTYGWFAGIVCSGDGPPRENCADTASGARPDARAEVVARATKGRRVRVLPRGRDAAQVLTRGRMPGELKRGSSEMETLLPRGLLDPPSPLVLSIGVLSGGGTPRSGMELILSSLVLSAEGEFFLISTWWRGDTGRARLTKGLDDIVLPLRLPRSNCGSSLRIGNVSDR